MASSRTHQAVEVLGYNEQEPWEACRINTRPTPSPGPSEVLVKVRCRPINPSDVLCIKGDYARWRPESFPAVPGLEGMGVVVQIGDKVSSVSVGQRVVPLSQNPDQTGQGLWQEYVVVHETCIIPIPDSIPDEAAAQFLINPWTVFGMFRVLAVPKGEYVLQTAAASVLGRMFIQYTHHHGVKTINIVRRNEQIEELKALGADEVINSNECNIVEKVKEITGGKMAYAAIDCVGGEMTKLVVESVKNHGKVLVYGLLAAKHVEVGISDLLFRCVKVEGFYLIEWVPQLSDKERVELAGHTWSMMAEKVIYPLIGEKYSLNEVKEAIKKSLQPGRGGKVLLISE